MLQPFISMTGRRAFFSIFLLLCSAVMYGQSYRMEIGGLGGGSFYMGDANQTRLFEEVHPAYGVLMRYHLNRRFSLKGNFLSAGISGKTTDKLEQYPGAEALDFSQRLLDGGVQLEFNFYEFGAADYYPGASKISPYVLCGIGLTGYKTDKNALTANIPLGLGIKLKLPARFNLGLECSYRMSFSDKLDYTSQTSLFQLDDPWIAQSAWNKNKDGYFILAFYVSYDLFYIGSKCYK